MGYSMDINCDLGEGSGTSDVDQEELIFPLITSCSVACGLHAGDPVRIERTLRYALQYGVQIGAHPSYPDREGFGRRPMTLSAGDLQAIVRYQVAALCGMAKAMGTRIAYVKPHGALYNRAADNTDEARAVIEAVGSLGESLAVMGLAGSVMQAVAKQEGIPFVAEAFADRRYRHSRLIPRSEPNAVINDLAEAASQAKSIVLRQQVTSPEGEDMAIEARSICVHGDHSSVVSILQQISAEFDSAGITKRAFIA